MKSNQQVTAGNSQMNTTYFIVFSTHRTPPIKIAIIIILLDNTKIHDYIVAIGTLAPKILFLLPGYGTTEYVYP